MQEKQQWYQKNQLNMSREDEQEYLEYCAEAKQEYLEYCAEAMFRIHILELRLNRLDNVSLNYVLTECRFFQTCFIHDFYSHKEMAPVKYQEMEHKLKADARFTA